MKTPTLALLGVLLLLVVPTDALFDTTQGVRVKGIVKCSIFTAAKAEEAERIAALTTTTKSTTPRTTTTTTTHAPTTQTTPPTSTPTTGAPSKSPAPPQHGSSVTPGPHTGPTPNGPPPTHPSVKRSVRAARSATASPLPDVQNETTTLGPLTASPTQLTPARHRRSIPTFDYGKILVELYEHDTTEPDDFGSAQNVTSHDGKYGTFDIRATQDEFTTTKWYVKITHTCKWADDGKTFVKEPVCARISVPGNFVEKEKPNDPKPFDIGTLDLSGKDDGC